MDENQIKWARVYGSLLKNIINCYLDKKTLIQRLTEVSEASLNQWLYGGRFPPKKKHINICEELKKHISAQNKRTLNMTDIKNYYTDLYNGFVKINNIDPDLGTEMGKYIYDSLKNCYSKGEKKLTGIAIDAHTAKTEYNIGDIFAPVGLKVTATYSNAPTEVIGISELTFSKIDLSKEGSKTVTVTYNGKSAEFPVTVNLAPFTSIDTFGKWLSAQPENTAVATVKLNVDDLCDDARTGGSLRNVLIANATKHVALDFSGSTFTKIGADAFKGCTSLTRITIPESVKRIGVSAFEDCTSLTRITIPNGVSSIGGKAFRNCTCLTSVMFQGKIDSSRLASDAFATLGNLRDKYLTGGIGNYITTAPVGSSLAWKKNQT